MYLDLDGQGARYAQLIRALKGAILDGRVGVGARLPASGVTYYEVPAQYGVRDYRYTVVNERPVLVDPRTHTIVQVIE